MPIGFAHRGARAEEGDNTLAAFRRALALGATGLESDVWVSADGVAVLDHDGWTSRLPVWRKRLSQVPRAALPPHMPSLAELLSACGPAIEVSLDIKDPQAMEAVWQAVRDCGEPARVWIVHPSLERLGQWRSKWGSLRYVNSVRARDVRADLGGWLDRAAAAGIDAVNLRHDEWTRAWIERVHDRGLGAFAWGAQRPHQLDRVLGFGVDAVYSDHVERMMRALARWAGASRPEGR